MEKIRARYKGNFSLRPGTISNRRVLRGSAVILSVSFNYINQVASTSICSVLNHRERLILAVFTVLPLGLLILNS